MLGVGHLMLASALSCDELKLSPGDLNAYSDALTEFMRWHVPTFKPDGKRGSELSLIMVMLLIYAPKVIAIQKRRAEQAARTIDGVPVPNAHMGV